MKTIIRILRKPLILIGFKFWYPPEAPRQLIGVLWFYLLICTVGLIFLSIMILSYMNISFLYFYFTFKLGILCLTILLITGIMIITGSGKKVKHSFNWAPLFIVLIVILFVLFSKNFILDGVGVFREQKIVDIESVEEGVNGPSNLAATSYYAKIKGEDEYYEFGQYDPNTKILKDEGPDVYKIIFLYNSKIILNAERP